MIRDRAEYETVLQEIDLLLDRHPSEGGEDFDRLEFLSVMLEDFDNRQFPLWLDVTPQEAVDLKLEQRHMTRADLHEVMGGRGRVAEFFAGKRELSKSQILALRSLLGIPGELLLNRRREE